MAKWQCGGCGWKYDEATPFEDTPDDFTCPMCGSAKSLFKKIEE